MADTASEPMEEAAHLDGNALGGVLGELFGAEMTMFHGCCANCGTVNMVGALLVYRSGPGDVVRCPNCRSVVMVATARDGVSRIHLAALRWLQPGS